MMIRSDRKRLATVAGTLVGVGDARIGRRPMLLSVVIEQLLMVVNNHTRVNATQNERDEQDKAKPGGIHIGRLTLAGWRGNRLSGHFPSPSSTKPPASKRKLEHTDLINNDMRFQYVKCISRSL